MADLRLAAWFLWITPLLAALSSLRAASRSSAVACSTSPVAAASLNLRTDVFSADLTDLLRSRRFSFCRLRLIWDLMFATRQPRQGRSGWSRRTLGQRHSTREEKGYQVRRRPAKTDAWPARDRR